ncbi:MAG: Aminopeptidase YwaD precursor [Firmicutes bacterium ADurb.BinA052]|nr:MAG: Aminopeptidase YwaD precursor [Firmicutes bacterium ADurb.BinA052]
METFAVRRRDWTRRRRALIDAAFALLVVAALIGAIRAECADEVDLGSIAGIICELSLPKYAGRLTGTDGNWAAVKYVADYFERLGLASPDGLDGYLQPYVQPTRLMHSPPRLEILDASGSVARQFKFTTQFSPSTAPGCRISGEVTAPGVILEHVDDIDRVRGEAVLLVPMHLAANPTEIEAVMRRVTSSSGRDQARLLGVVLEVDTSGRGYFPIGSFVAPGSFPTDRGDAGRQSMAEPASNEPMVFTCDRPTFAELAARSAAATTATAAASSTSRTIRMSTDYSVEPVRTANVVGVLPGGARHIIVGAHLDHVGSNMDGTYNAGAMDNASGVAAMIEIARALSASPVRPPLTVVFVAFNGEEQFMYGSRHYVSEPCLPLGDAIMVNIDTVGSPRGVLLQIENAAGRDTQLVRDLCSAAAQLGMGFRKSASSGTDHSSFANAGVEAANLIQPDFAGGYHGPGDTADGVDPGRVAEVVRLVLAYIRTARTAPPD